MTRITSGITPLDAQLGGVIAGRIHLLIGVPGTGKTSTTLHFLQAALHAGEQAALLTRDRGADLISHAAHLGIDLRPALRSGQLSAVRYHTAIIMTRLEQYEFAMLNLQPFAQKGNDAPRDQEALARHA